MGNLVADLQVTVKFARFTLAFNRQIHSLVQENLHLLLQERIQLSLELFFLMLLL